jgi:hypothetical protein
MKTAISIPDDVFTAAEALAERLALSRSELYVRAIREYVRMHHGDGMTDRINAVCERVDTAIDPAWLRAQREILPDEGW